MNPEVGIIKPQHIYSNVESDYFLISFIQTAGNLSFLLVYETSLYPVLPCKHKRFAAYFTFAFPVEHTPTFVFLSLRGLLLT